MTAPIGPSAMAERPRVNMDPSATYRRLVPVDRLVPPITPSDDVYVIAHMGVARVDVTHWQLAVDGLTIPVSAMTAPPNWPKPARATTILGHRELDQDDVA